MSKFVDIKNPQWANPEKTIIDLQVKLKNETQYVPYSAMVCDDVEATQLFYDAVANKLGVIAEVDTTRWAIVQKSRRDSLLKASDWSQLPDVPQVVKDKWAIYRQALRNITAQPGFPLSITFPTEPN